MPVAGQLIAAKYQLEHQLGAGGMGCVWLATHLELGSKVAIKFQLDHRADSPEAVARFRREARAAAQLRSAHVVHIYDYGLDAGVPYIAMEFLVGESLRTRLERDVRLAPSAVAWIVPEVAAGLDMAHQVGIIHRDIKPANLFIARDGAHEVVKLLDFGIAKWTDPHPADVVPNTTTAAVLGSAAYMSPEQARGQPLDHRTDLWSLGAVSYEMLTGKVPFEAPNIPATLRKLELGEFDPPSSALGVPTPELDQVFARALAPQIDDRFGTGGGFAQELVLAIKRFTEHGVDPMLPETARVFGRVHSTATMRSVVSSPAHRERKPPRTRVLLIGMGALGVAWAAGWMLSAKAPTQSGGSTALPVSTSPSPPLVSAVLSASVASSQVAPAASSAVPRAPSANSANPAVPAAPPPKAATGSKPGAKPGPLSKDL